MNFKVYVAFSSTNLRAQSSDILSLKKGFMNLLIFSWIFSIKWIS